MDFNPDNDAADLAAAVRLLLNAQLDRRGLREVIMESQRRGALWLSLCKQGVTATLVSETCGGLGLGWPAAVAVLEEIGHSGAPGPLIDALAVSPDVLRLFEHECTSVLTQMAEGRLKVGIADRDGRVYAHDELDSILILSDRSPGVTALGLYPAEHVSFHTMPSLDEASGVSRAVPVGTPDFEIALSDYQCGRIEAAGNLATAAALIGVCRRMLAMTTDYVSQRVAFGSIIGTFQAIQHPLVEVSLRIELAAPVVQAAAWAMTHDRPDQLQRSAHAKLAAIQAANLAWRVCLQSHGAIGYTEEYDLQIWLKRALTLSAQHGSAAEVRHVLRKQLIERVELRDHALL